MKDNFIKEKIIKDKTELQIQNEILKSIIQTKQELDYANKNFEYAQGDLIDYYAYEIKANRAKLDYLMKKAKKQGKSKAKIPIKSEAKRARREKAIFLLFEKQSVIMEI